MEMTSRTRRAIRVLLLAANPPDTERLRLDLEAKKIQDQLEGARVRADVRYIPAVDASELPHRLRSFRPTFLHFAGHGDRAKGLILQNEAGESQPLDARALAALFNLVKGVRCVFLNNCHSLLSATLVAEFVPYVIGMRAPISDPAAIKFACGFYGAIADGESIESAFNNGKWAIGSAGFGDAAEVPELIRQPTPPTAASPAQGPRSTPRGDLEIPSLDELTHLSWEDFEAFALRVVAAIYSGTNLKLTHDRYVGNRLRQGEAQYILGLGLESDLQVSFRIWLEVTQKHGNVSKPEVTQHLLQALTEHINKIILVTNSSFTVPLRSWIDAFSVRTGVQVQLLDGPALIQQAETFLSPRRDVHFASRTVAPSPPTMTLVHWYTLHPFDGRPRDLQQLPIVARHDRPLFLVTDVRLLSDAEPCKIRISALPPQGSGMAIEPWPPVPHSPDFILASAGEQLRRIFLIWPDARLDDSIANISLQVESDSHLHVERLQLNSVKIPYSVLSPTRLRSQARIMDSLAQKIAAWIEDGTLFSGLLMAPPGLGKSHILAKVRRLCHAKLAREFFIDCETTKTDIDLIRGLFRSILPVPSGLLDQELADPIKEWCESINVPPEQATQIAHDLCAVPVRETSIGVGSRLEIASAVLSFSAARQPLYLIIEDLHKASPSLLSLLGALTSRFAAYGASRIFLLATTRPLYAGLANLREEWLAALSGISWSDQSDVYKLEAPTQEEARTLLTSSIVGLENFHADVILQAVGTSPYALREGALFLLSVKALELAQFGSSRQLAVADPSRLRIAVLSESLKRATQQRLLLLFETEPPWLRSLLLGGAAYGRRFPISTLLSALGLEDDVRLGEALRLCATWSVLSATSESSEWLEFDHDLIREAILELGPVRLRTNVAKAVLDALGSGADLHLKCRLAYQADLAEACLDAAWKAKQQARAESRAADIVELNQLAIQVLDPRVAEGVLSELLNTGDQHLVDPSLRHVSPPRLRMERQERLHLLLHLLLENIDCLSTVASGSSRATEVAISEARVIAELLRDNGATASLLYFEGRMWFERNMVEKALQLHREAEDRFSQLGLSRLSERCENLIREAICLRQKGQVEESILLLFKVARLRPGGNWTILSKVRSNMGAAFLYSDWTKVRHHWEREVRQAARRGLVARKVHALTGLSFIDLFEGRLQEGYEKSREALELSEHLRLDGQILRLCLNLSVHALIVGNFEEGKLYLLKAEDLALRHGVGRRLWRVAANLATVEEVLGSSERSLARDLQVIRHLGPEYSEMRVDGREMLPIVNLVLRSRRNGAFLRLLDNLPARIVGAAESYASALDRGDKELLPGLLGRYCVALEVGGRLLVTE
jgi:tetratricopeptide (TPR) repeat protein